MGEKLKCPNCGTEGTTPGSYCTSCGSRLASAPPAEAQNQTTTPPEAQPTYGPPPVVSTAPVLFRAAEPIVKSVHLGGMMFLISASLLIAVGLQNLGWAVMVSAPPLYVLLGLIAIPVGFLLLALEVMPSVLKPLDQVLDLLVFGASALFLLWGLLGAFVSGVAAYGGFLFVAGLFGLGGMGLRLGMLK